MKNHSAARQHPVTSSGIPQAANESPIFASTYGSSDPTFPSALIKQVRPHRHPTFSSLSHVISTSPLHFSKPRTGFAPRAGHREVGGFCDSSNHTAAGCEDGRLDRNGFESGGGVVGKLSWFLWWAVFRRIGQRLSGATRDQFWWRIGGRSEQNPRRERGRNEESCGGDRLPL